MKKIILILFVIFTAANFSSCAWFEEFENDVIIGSYCASSIDSQGRKITVGVSESGGDYSTIIDADVYSIGHNGKYIFAKQKERFSKDSITNYFLIDTIKNVINKKGVYGPLTEIEFEKLTKKLKISSVIFDLNYQKN